jgi:tRNA(Ile)-lysidine synthase
MRTLADRVRRALRKHALVDRGSRLVVALSGGPDSVALAHVLAELAETNELALAGLAHFNHQLRAAAARDEGFCREVAERIGLPIDVEGADVRGLAAERRMSIEDAAREARYAFLERAADRLGADRIAVGHTRDDQAETFLLRVLRGAGPRGLAGIHPRIGRVIRPFIDTTRAEVLDYLAARSLPSCDDETNRDLANPRNRIRHELLPYLGRHLSPGVVSVLAREAVIAREDAEYLERAAADADGVCVSAGDRGLELDAARLRGLHPAVSRRVVRRALLRSARDRFVSFEHVDLVMDLVRGGARGGADLPGLRAEWVDGRIVLSPAADRSTPSPAASGPARALPVPGEVVMVELGCAVAAERGVADDAVLERQSARALEVAIDAESIVEPLAVRTRHPGDALHPLGLGGRKKLQDLFVDKKVERDQRDTVPLVVDARNQIVWVVGLTIDETVRVPSAGRAVIFLKAKRLGGQG